MQLTCTFYYWPTNEKTPVSCLATKNENTSVEYVSPGLLKQLLAAYTKVLAESACDHEMSSSISLYPSFAPRLDDTRNRNAFQTVKRYNNTQVELVRYT